MDNPLYKIDLFQTDGAGSGAGVMVQPTATSQAHEIAQAGTEHIQNLVLRGGTNTRNMREAIVRARVKANEAIFNQPETHNALVKDCDFNRDSLGASTGTLAANALEYRVAEIMEKYQPLNAMALYPVNSSTPEGAQEGKIYRTSLHADVRWHKGNANSAPTAGVERDWYPIRYEHVIGGWDWDVFTDQAMAFGGFNDRGAKMMAVLRAFDQFYNRHILRPSSETGILDMGMFNVPDYPWAGQTATTYVWGAGTAVQDLAELERIVDTARLRSKGIYGSTRLCLGLRLESYLGKKEYAINGSDAISVLEVFLRRQANRRGQPGQSGGGGVTSIVPMHELDPSDGGLTGGRIIADIEGPEGFHVSLPTGRTPIMLPVFLDRFRFYQPMYSAFGGVECLEPESVMIEDATYNSNVT